MITSPNRMILHTIFMASALMISACASFNTDQTTRAAIEAPLEPPTSAAQAIEPVDVAFVKAPENAVSDQSAITRITQKELYVNVRTSPSVKSRIVGVLKRGQSIEVLEAKDSWVKIAWNKGRAVKQGWLKKMFVEGYEQ